MLGNLGYGEIILIAFIALMLFGAKRLPEIGNSLGKSIRMFKKGIKDLQEELPGSDDYREDQPRRNYNSESRPQPKSQPDQNVNVNKDEN